MSARKARDVAVVDLPPAPPDAVPPSIVRVRTDDLSRHPESQIRAQSDPRLVAEYAEAMLEGVVFPPVVIFEDDDGARYLSDGHHRVDAAALAALIDPRFPAEVAAEIRRGTFEDALRHSMRANVLHGKRMTDADYKRAIGIAFDHKMIAAAHAKDVVPEIVELTGCSVRTAQIYSTDHRQGMIARRDAHIWAMHREGRTQEAICVALEVPRQTVTDVIKRIAGKRSVAESGHLPKRKPPMADWAAEDDESEDDATSAGAPDVEAVKPAFKIDVSPYLPLLEKLRPIDEGGDDQESGAVGLLPDIDLEDVEDDPKAVAAFDSITHGIGLLFGQLTNLDGLQCSYRPSSAAPIIELIVRAVDRLGELQEYIEGKTP